MPSLSRTAGNSGSLLPPLCRKSIEQRQPIETLTEPAREIVVPALALHAAPLPDLIHGHTQDQYVVHQRRADRAEFMLGAVQPQHRLALALGDRLASLPAIDIFAAGIDRPRAALGLLPIVLKRPAALILRLVNLPMGVQPRQRIIADRAQRDDLVAGIEAQGIVDLDGRHFRVAQETPRSPVVDLCWVIWSFAFCPW